MAASAGDSRIRRHLLAHGVRLAMERGRRVLQRADDTGSWLRVLTPQAVRTWPAALTVAVSLHLAPPLPAVADIGPESFAGCSKAIPTAPGEPEIKLGEWQYDAIMENARVTILCWARQTGKDFTASLKAVLDALDTGQNWYIVSLTQRQAMATAKKAQMHAKAITGVLGEMAETESWVNGVKITSYGVRLPNGAEIVALPGKDPDALAGLTGNVIFTEMALFPNGGVEHWRVVFPLTTRGFKVWAISTPRGPDTKFSELRRNVQGLYAVHNCTIVDAARRGLDLRDDKGQPMDVETLRRLYNDEAGWSREYLCIEGDDHDPLIPWADIHGCATGRAPVIRWVNGRVGIPMAELVEQFDVDGAEAAFFRALRAELRGSPIVGYDVAVTGDLAVLAYGDQVGAVSELVALVIFTGVDDFEFQRRIVELAMDTGAVGEGDASGLGRETCQTLTKRYGEARFAGVVFTGPVKSELFTRQRSRMQSRQFAYGRNDLVAYDFHALGKEGLGVQGKLLRVVTNRNSLERRSHADIATAATLMADAGAAASAGPVMGEALRLARLGGADYGRREREPMRPDHADDDLACVGSERSAW